MIKDKEWYAFFSHTGEEIYNIYKAIGILPDKIITNQPPDSKSISKKLLKLKTEIIYISSKPTAQDYERLLHRCDDCICTLHGWMRIIPPKICKDYKFYNLHPGLITVYPELKGKDPQARVCHETHDWIGCVIHKVTRGVDEGPILMTCKVRNHFSGEQQITDRLKEMALSMWEDIIRMEVI